MPGIWDQRLRNNACGQSILEYEPNCPLASDYYDLMCFMWDVINDRRDILEKISKEELELEA
ncbi:hypothetical protein AVM70_16245 (plasmid) [Piscirickettsia salmonis]|nr:hypothetical protein PSLF89_08815 [Piscirickettsia salmonis LF-89 = ATCC VR-1361]ALY04635.1 hypothetical protein AWE47_17150 [Piscirickettsia salmonis]APS75124.1 hypothetical protein AVM70_16245 [Piscirickettsia salmonis]APS84754.1 hypothetical protein AVM71_16790 [Piscirickettsia salmonis]